MTVKIPEELKADMPRNKFGKMLAATPVVMAVIATLLAGLASSEMTRAQYDRAGRGPVEFLSGQAAEGRHPGQLARFAAKHRRVASPDCGGAKGCRRTMAGPAQRV